eukprot:Nk52_evm1s2177 gene=Nk52_evmTU1s2177
MPINFPRSSPSSTFGGAAVEGCSPSSSSHNNNPSPMLNPNRVVTKRRNPFGEDHSQTHRKHFIIKKQSSLAQVQNRNLNNLMKAGASSSSAMNMPQMNPFSSQMKNNNNNYSSNNFNGQSSSQLPRHERTFQNPSLLFAASSNSGQMRICYVCNKASTECCNCYHCERNTCDNCMRNCSQCQNVFCSVCSIVNYDQRYDRVFCFSCNDEIEAHDNQRQQPQQHRGNNYNSGCNPDTTPNPTRTTSLFGNSSAHQNHGSAQKGTSGSPSPSNPFVTPQRSQHQSQLRFGSGRSSVGALASFTSPIRSSDVMTGMGNANICTPTSSLGGLGGMSGTVPPPSLSPFNCANMNMARQE